MTLTPSRIACSTAAALSEPKQPSSAAHLVLDDPGAGSDAADRAAVDAEDRRVATDVAGRGARGVGAVAVAVTGGVRVDLAADDRVVGRRGTAGRRSACGCRRTRRLAGVSGLSPKSQARGVAVGRGRRVAERRVVGERRVLGPHAGVEVAEDHALAGQRLAALLRPQMVGAPMKVGARRRSAACSARRLCTAATSGQGQQRARPGWPAARTATPPYTRVQAAAEPGRRIGWRDGRGGTARRCRRCRPRRTARRASCRSASCR